MRHKDDALMDRFILKAARKYKKVPDFESLQDKKV